MRSHRRRGPLEHVLVAGDADELTAIQALLLLLPPNVYGQVFVETAPEVTLPSITTPPRVTVTQLRRQAEVDAGELVTAAVHGWLAEWAPEQPDPTRSCTLWVGASARDRVDAAGATLEVL